MCEGVREFAFPSGSLGVVCVPCLVCQVRGRTVSVLEVCVFYNLWCQLSVPIAFVGGSLWGVCLGAGRTWANKCLLQRRTALR
jgi:hypothetical protein